jgi:hypothetical protein
VYKYCNLGLGFQVLRPSPKPLFYIPMDPLNLHPEVPHALLGASKEAPNLQSFHQVSGSPPESIARSPDLGGNSIQLQAFQSYLKASHNPADALGEKIALLLNQLFAEEQPIDASLEKLKACFSFLDIQPRGYWAYRSAHYIKAYLEEKCLSAASSLSLLHSLYENLKPELRAELIPWAPTYFEPVKTSISSLKDKDLLSLIIDLQRFLGSFSIPKDALSVNDCIPLPRLAEAFSYYLQDPPLLSQAQSKALIAMVAASTLTYVAKHMDNIIPLLEKHKDYFVSLGLSEPYTKIYTGYLENYFNYKRSEGFVFLIQDGKDEQRLAPILQFKLERFIKNEFDPAVLYADLPFHKHDFKLMDAIKAPEGILTISNNEGYFPFNSAEHGLEGSSLKLSARDDTPIGYNIHLPKQPRAVLVSVYGGKGGFLTAERAADDALKPKALGNFENTLLNHNIAYVTLNLPDLRELDSINASLMPEALHQKLHACIDQFYRILKDSPEHLDGRLSILKGLPLFLQGGSFGGRTAIRHAELYPDSFQGFISHDGVLSYTMAGNTDRPIVGRLIDTRMHEGRVIEGASEFMDPAKHIDAIQRPLLLMHNYDDNNVNMQVSLDFYQAAKRLDKPIHLGLIPQGNETVGVNKGHFLPRSPKLFEHYMQQVLSFILNGISPLAPALNEWRAHEYGTYMDKHTQNRKTAWGKPFGSLEQAFLSHAYRLYKNARPDRPLEGDSLKPKEAPAFMNEADKVDATWNAYYLPLYKAYYTVEACLKHPNLIDGLFLEENLESLVTQATESFLEQILPSLEETLAFQLHPQTVNLPQLARTLNPYFMDLLKNRFEAKDSLAQPFLLALFSRHPHLVSNTLPVHKIKTIEEQGYKLKAQFLKLIHESKQRGAKVMSESFLSLHRQGRLKELVEGYRKEKQ